MAKDYFQDITPPGGGGPIRPSTPGPDQGAPTPPPQDHDEAQSVPIHITEVPDAEPEPVTGMGAVSDPSIRGIRNISAPTRIRPRLDPDVRAMPGVGLGGLPPQPRQRLSRLWIWALAALSLLVLGSLFLFIFRSTKVTVTPKSEGATLSGTSPLIARAAEGESSDVLTYTVQMSDLEDSEVVPVQGTTHVETKASGSITVYNSYSASPVRLVKNTRFEGQGGLIFRAPADVVVPGRSGTNPGSINITVVADEAGEKYNIPPTARFTLPALRSTAAMYSGVYAKSSAAMVGGFSGDRPGAAPGALESAVAQVRSRLEAKARESALAQAGDNATIFPELVAISYQTLPNTTEAGGGVRIHEKAHIEIPVFPSESLAHAIAESAGINADMPVIFKPGDDFAVQVASTTPRLGQALTFSVSGSGLVVWKVDAAALSEALMGRSSDAFQGIVNGFPSVQEAHARIEPFWKSTFPAKASDIKIILVEPEAAR